MQSFGQISVKGERFLRDSKNMEERHQGRWNEHLMTVTDSSEKEDSSILNNVIFGK